MSLAEIPQLQNLSPEEKLALIDELWDSIDRERIQFPMTDELKALLDERLAAHEAHPEEALSEEEFDRLVAERL